MKKVSSNKTERFDRDLFLHKVATKKPSPQYIQEQNFIEIFEVAAWIKRRWRIEGNIMENGSGI